MNHAQPCWCVECDRERAALKPFVCPRCGVKSHNPNDKLERYCGRCHAFVDDPPASESMFWRPKGGKLSAEAQWIKDGGWSGKR
jgi:hypothetical protein